MFQFWPPNDRGELGGAVRGIGGVAEAGNDFDVGAWREASITTVRGGKLTSSGVRCNPTANDSSSFESLQPPLSTGDILIVPLDLACLCQPALQVRSIYLVGGNVANFSRLEAAFLL